jgi:hypothetical protein
LSRGQQVPATRLLDVETQYATCISNNATTNASNLEVHCTCILSTLLCLTLITSGRSLGTKQKNRPPFCTENGAPTHVRFGGVQPLTKPCSESDPARTRIGRVESNLLDARLVQLLILASLRVVRPQASSPSFKGALRQSSPKVASPLAIF